MKKFLMAAALLIAAQSVSAQAFIGGSVGFTTVKDGITSFSVVPEVGYALNDRWDVGIGLGIGTTSVKDLKNSSDTKFSYTNWEVSPFVRYSAIQFGKFEIMLKGSISYVGSSNKGFVMDEDGDIDMDMDLGGETLKTTFFGVRVIPMIAYNISERFTITANLNCLGASFGQFEEKIGASNNKTTMFAINADTNNLLNTSDFQIGFAYNF